MVRRQVEPSLPANAAQVIRGIGLRGAVGLNVITMIGIGPLVTIPLVLAKLAGPLALAGWIGGAIVALCDGLVWAELSSRYPGSGGTYVYLREVFGAKRWGRLLAFLFNWQFLLFAPFLLASGYIGFANYLGYLVPAVATSYPARVAVSVAVGAIVMAVLYRRITSVARIGLWLALAAVGTLLLVIAAAFSHAHAVTGFSLPNSFSLGSGFIAGFGGALYVTLYDYVGYSDAALLGDEVRSPRRTIPAAIVLSILIVAALYVALQVGVLSAIPWQRLVGPNGPPVEAQFVASTVVANAWGTLAARIVTILILVTAFASLFGNLVGFARVPFAAARDGIFLRPFALLHPRDNMPHVSLLIIGFISLCACFFSLDQVIAILTAGIVLIQSVAQIVAVFVLRARGERPPFSMWLFPLPALVALAGWLYAFLATGTAAITYSVVWLAAGTIVYLLLARRQRAWPFAAAAALGVLAIMLVQPLSARAQSFVYGAAFFYERIPRAQWQPSLQRYRAMGVNTIDLYVPWNWHEPREGVLDFTGRTNSRRDLLGLLRLIRADGFKIVLRPGPVIRNEWRNGGYPAWLLERPAYGMPLRDVLEGRYPATATLQNAHSDDAALQWMNNATHMRYATRWLQRVLRVVAPWRSSIVAVALDDDQGAYIDNQTWPAPHFQRYIRYLASVVHGVFAAMPVFINTYQMKVTASAPVWAWGNWYQSDAYSIGEHDREQLEFSTGLLQTQPARDVMISEFQAGWLQGADEAVPRPADPSNTTLALHTMLQLGAHGVVNFPVQDTLNPAGWEAPWANAFYSWDAALAAQLSAQARWMPTARFGALITRYGTALAATQPAADAAIAYLTSAYDPRALTNPEVAQIAQATMDAQRGCRNAHITCRLIDLRYSPLADMRRFRVLIVPRTALSLPFTAEVARKLHAYRASGGRIVRDARVAGISHPAAGGIPDAALLVSRDGRYAFLDVVNYSRVALRTRAARVHGGSFRADVPALTVPARDALLLALGAVKKANPQLPVPPRALTAHTVLPLRSGSWIDAHLVPSNAQRAYRADVYGDGYPAVVFEDAVMRLIVSPCAGGRALIFENKRTQRNLFTTVGGLRDAWTPQLPPSTRDYIAKYTHPIEAGTFNRCYAVTLHGRSATFAYTAPDAPPHGADFTRTVVLDATPGSFTVTERAEFAGSSTEQAQQLTSFAAERGAKMLRVENGCAVFDPAHRALTLVGWKRSSIADVRLQRHDADALLTLTFRRGRTASVRYGVGAASSVAQAQAALLRFANRV